MKCKYIVFILLEKCKTCTKYLVKIKLSNIRCKHKSQNKIKIETGFTVLDFHSILYKILQTV